MDKYVFQVCNSYIAESCHSGLLLLLPSYRDVSKPERYSGDNIIYKPPGVSCYFLMLYDKI